MKDNKPNKLSGTLSKQQAELLQLPVGFGASSHQHWCTLYLVNRSQVPNSCILYSHMHTYSQITAKMPSMIKLY